MVELKVCPFCGASAKLISDGSTAYVQCKRCFARSAIMPITHAGPSGEGVDGEKNAAGNWNRRVSNFNEHERLSDMRPTTGVAAHIDREPRLERENTVHIHIHMPGVWE